MKKNTKYIILSFLVVLGIVLVIIGSSYSLFNYQLKGKTKNKITTGIYNSCEYENGTEWTFDYTGSEQTFTVPCDGEYQLETWGAQGGGDDTYVGGFGGYSIGRTDLDNNTKLFVNVGGAGGYCYGNICTANGGYNGGGGCQTLPLSSTGTESTCGAGGGATHIATRSGLLSSLSSKKDSVLIVSGGGGGGNLCNICCNFAKGGHGGGYIGVSAIDMGAVHFSVNGGLNAIGGTQSSGNVFGLGGGVTTTTSVGAGGGWYGGVNSGINGAGGGSGYIGNSLLVSKRMYCYNCSESADESTKTISTTNVSKNPISSFAKMGNGYVKITLVKSYESYKEALLNGANPVLKDNLVPIQISANGTVTKANIYNKWYSYENKEWANAVILKDESITYANNETIPESNIESYFVWIPRYKYKIFDEGNYTDLTSIESKEQVIEIVFENKDTAPSNGQTKDSYLTHPAFTSFDSNGFWVGKFETGYDGATTTAQAQVNSVATDKIIIKPNVYSWRSITVGNMFKNSYDYIRELDSHMMKNTEWGAVAYLQHSAYGSDTSVRINNNSAYITGYSAKVEPTLGYNGGNSIEGNRVESTSIGIDGTYTVNYLNISSIASSTTGNYTGIYDMSGGTWEYVMGYTTGASTVGGSSGITDLYSDFFNDVNYTKYWDRYMSTLWTNYNNRILGDATGEMGPFESHIDPDNGTRYKSSWYMDYACFARSSSPWFYRGGDWYDGARAGNFAFFTYDAGGTSRRFGYRIVLTPNLNF